MPALVNRRNHLLCIAEAIYRLNISRWSTILSHTEYAALKCHRCEARDRPPPPIFCMQIWYPSHHRTSPAAVFIKSAATYCNNNSHYVSDIHADNTASVWRGLFITDYIPPLLPPLSSLLLSPASLTGFFFQPPPPLHPPPPPPPTPLTFPLRDSEGSLRAEVRHDPRHRYHRPAVWPHRRRVRSNNNTIRATPPTVGVGVLLSPVPPPRSVPSPGSRCLSLSPPTSPLFSPNNKERLLAFLVVLPPSTTSSSCCCLSSSSSPRLL